MQAVDIENQATIPLQAARFGVLERVMALAEFDLDGHLIHANPNYLEMLQLQGTQWQGRTHQSFCSPALGQSPAYADMWKSLRAGQEFSGVVERVRSDGSTC